MPNLYRKVVNVLKVGNVMTETLLVSLERQMPPEDPVTVRVRTYTIVLDYFCLRDRRSIALEALMSKNEVECGDGARTTFQ